MGAFCAGQPPVSQQVQWREDLEGQTEDTCTPGEVLVTRLLTPDSQVGHGMGCLIQATTWIKIREKKKKKKK